MSLMNETVNTCPGVPQTNLFLGLINALFAAQCQLEPPVFEDYGPNLKDGQNFDFIIVGAGASGSVIANRLSENSKWQILLLEAGTDPSVISQIPGLSFSTGDTPEDWDFKTQSQPGACQGIEAKQCDYPAGKALGGSTTINTMLYIRGNKKDYDTWASMGNTGWNFDNVLQYFKKSEDNQQFGANKMYHSTGGNLKVGYFREGSSPLEDIITKAASELGYKNVQDFNSENWIGYGKIQGTVFDGVRQSTATAFLEPAKQRKNLYIAKNARITKINMDKIIAKGVTAKINGKSKTLNAKKEIIISAGTLNTPKILMLSGIGPKDHLSQLNIPLVQDLPVGQNFQDHMLFSGLFVTLKARQDEWDQPIPNIDTIYQYYMNRSGDLAGVNLLDYMGFVNTDRKSEYPNLQYEHIFFPKGYLDTDDIVLRYIGYDTNLANRIKEINREYSFFVPLLKVINPKSRGYIRLKSKDPNDNQLFYPNYLTEKDDIDNYIKGIRHVEMLLRTPSFSKYKPEIIDVKIPECTAYKFSSDNYWKCNLKYMGVSDFHYAGTSKMGPVGDKTAVVTPRLKVKGVNGLRVADASIIPKITSGNTMAPSIMIGEKAADMIKEDWGYTPGSG